MGAVSKRHLVSALFRGDIRAFFIREVIAVIVTITEVGHWYTSSMVTRELPRSAGARGFVTVVATVVVTITQPGRVKTLEVARGCCVVVGAGLLAWRACTSGAVPLIRLVIAVRSAVTPPLTGDTLTVVTLELMRCAGRSGALFLVAMVTTVIIKVTLVGYWDTNSIITQEVVVVCASSCASHLISSTSTVVLPITPPRDVNTPLRTCVLVGCTRSCCKEPFLRYNRQTFVRFDLLSSLQRINYG